MDSINSKPQLDRCHGCDAPDGRVTEEWGVQCPRCEVMLLRYSHSLHELNAFVETWLARWEAVGLPRFEAYEHLKDQMLDVGRTISPKLGEG